MTIVTRMVTLLRRAFWMAVIGGAGFAAWSAWNRRTTSANAPPPEWPRIEPPANVLPPAPQAADLIADEPVAPPPDASEPTVREAVLAESDALPAAPDTQLDSPANPPFGATTSGGPSEDSPSGALTWVASDGGVCPSSHPIKANNNSGIFHVPGGRFYNQTRAERCYALAEDAETDGYRRAKS